MDLTVTINDENGNPTKFNARSIHIESNPNSINVLPVAAADPSVETTTIPQQQVQATQQPHPQEYTEEYLKNQNDFNAAKQQINEQMKKKYSETPNNTQALAQEHQDMINKATNLANSKLAVLQTNNQVFKPPPVLKTGGSKKRHNKRAKRTRKQRRSRKRSTKR